MGIGGWVFCFLAVNTIKNEFTKFSLSLKHLSLSDRYYAGAHYNNKKGSITSVQAIYVPADDLTDPAPATTFAHLDATTVLSRAIAELGIYPAVDPLDSTSRIMDPNIIGMEHYQVARAIQKILQDYKSLQDIIAILGNISLIYAHDY